MPKIMPEEEEMGSLHSDEMPGGHESEEKHSTIDEEAQDETADTDVIKTAVLKGSPDDKVEAGDERVVTVLEVYGDTCKVKYAPKKESEEPASEEMNSDQEIDQMSESGPKY